MTTQFIKEQQELGRDFADEMEDYLGCNAGELANELNNLITEIITNTGEELMRIIKDERNKIPDKFEQPFELAESVGSKMTLDTLKKHITSVTGVENLLDDNKGV